MQLRTKLMAFALFLASATAVADLEPWKDYEASQQVWSVTTIRVQPNMDDAYLEGIYKTWVATNEAAKKLGQIEDYEIFRSDLPQSGDFNLLLIVRFAKTDDLAPNKERYEAFVKEFSKTKLDETNVFSQKNYPAMREITGEYLFRRITFKK